MMHYRSLLFSLCWLLPHSIHAEDISPPPLVEAYLHTGQFKSGELALEAQLRKQPQDDQARLGLGILRIVQGVERMGQSFYDYGLKPKSTWVPFVRLPIPTNPDPQPVSYRKFRSILDNFQHDLMEAERTLAAITDDRVKLRIRLAPIKLDLDGDGQATDSFMDILIKLMGNRPEFLQKNPEFRVHFDRGDVAWFRAYCHLLSSMLDIYLSFDSEADFYFFAKDHFPRVKPFLSQAEEKLLMDKTMIRSSTIKFQEPGRLSSFRHHMLSVCSLNRETWRFIRAENDDDYEWLPSSTQKGIFGMPVNDNMVNSWLGMLTELEAVLNGKKLVPLEMVMQTNGKGLNLKTFLEEPPSQFDFNKLLQEGPSAKFMEKGEGMNLNAIIGMLNVFDSPLRMGYFAWFN